MKEKAIAIFDVGKTNKKLVIFDYKLNLLFEEEKRFEEETDDDGFGCDNINAIEKWIKESVKNLVRSSKFDITAINFATYGATLAYLDEYGKRLTPVYNYLKPIDERIPEKLYRRYGGQDEFCRRTASPALGMLNSGIQILWLKTAKPEVFSRVRHILHFPQYLANLITGKVCSEHTSIGCHTALWDFDNMRYHTWLEDAGITLPDPIPVGTLNEIIVEGKRLMTGIGIHDSSASLAPYLTASKGKFILLSTGTWCINMNPFNYEKLTAEQLDRDCLCYLSVNRQPVKSSRIFLGHMHETAVEMINNHFRTTDDFYKSVKFDIELVKILRAKYAGDKRAFFDSGPASREFKDKIDLYDFKSYDEAYHQLMIELCDLTCESIKLIIPEYDETENIYITGGFSRNEIFVRLLAQAFPSKRVFTSVINNSTALGAALVILPTLETTLPELNLGLSECKMTS